MHVRANASAHTYRFRACGDEFRSIWVYYRYRGFTKKNSTATFADYSLRRAYVNSYRICYIFKTSNDIYTVIFACFLSCYTYFLKYFFITGLLNLKLNIFY